MKRKRVSFVYPCDKPGDAIAEWVRMLGRHAQRYWVTLDTTVGTLAEATFILTSAAYFTRESIDAEIVKARAQGNSFAVLHHNDHGQPTPGAYPSAVWTQTGWARLRDYRATFVRMPVMPRVYESEAGKLLMGTFGHIEPKKQTLEMHRSMKAIGAPFVAFGPDIHQKLYADYLEQLRQEGCRVELHPWKASMEECDWLAQCSHFLFVLPPSKRSTGGGSMTPREVTIFGRPVIVVDDELSYSADGFQVFADLTEITLADLLCARAPYYAFGPDAYLDELCWLARRSN